MEKVLILLQEYYKYILFVLEFLGALIASICAIVYKIKHKKILSDCNAYSDLCDQNMRLEEATAKLPFLIKEANILYPVHGDGDLRFQYVYSKFCEFAQIEKTRFWFTHVKILIDSILSADDVPKIYKNTEKEVLNETSENEEEERPARVFAYGKKDESN